MTGDWVPGIAVDRDGRPYDPGTVMAFRRRRGAYFVPEVGLPPGYDPPSADLTAPPNAAEIAARLDEIADRYGLDPRWHWCDVRTISDPAPVWIKGECRHIETVPVNLLLTGETVARLCLTCDTRLPVPGWP